MDIIMPEMNGQTAVKNIRALEEAWGTRSSDGAKIMTTALDDMKNVESFQSLCDAYLFKPIDQEIAGPHPVAASALRTTPTPPREKRECKLWNPTSWSIHGWPKCRCGWAKCSPMKWEVRF